MVKVFVYGTLRKNEPNSEAMQGTDFLGIATTCEKYPLVIASPFNIPFILNLPGIGHRVMGEIYDVTPEKLQELDKFENVPVLYDRLSIEVEMIEYDVSSAEKNQEVDAYILNGFKEDLLEKEMISDYCLDKFGQPSYIHPILRSEEKEKSIAKLCEAVKAKWNGNVNWPSLLPSFCT